MAPTNQKFRTIPGGLGDDPKQPPDPPDMNERLARVEEAVRSLREHLNIALAVVGIVVLILLYGIARVDQLSEKVGELPDKVGAQLRDISKTLADSITAAKQASPQVIIMPAPQAQPNNSK